MSQLIVTNQHTDQTLRMVLELTFDPEQDQELIRGRLELTGLSHTWDWWEATTLDGAWLSSSEL